MTWLTAFVLLWPIAQAVLVARYHVDPWELFGWSMYSRPAARVQVKVEAERDGTVAPLRAMGEQRRLIVDFARRRTALGELAPSDRLAETILHGDPELDALRITTREILLDRKTASLVARDQIHRYTRSGLIGENESR